MVPGLAPAAATSPATDHAASGTLAGDTPQPAPLPEPTTPPPPSPSLLFSDDFNGPTGTSPDPNRWSFDTGGAGWGNNELESYTARAANAEVDGEGHLALTARREAYVGADGISRGFTSARLQTLNTFQFRYGVMEARIMVPSGQGLVAQFWALGREAYEAEDAWPGCGEIDTMEVLGSEPSVVNGTLHGPWSSAPTGVGGTAIPPASLAGGYHTYSASWEPGRVRFLLDGSVYETVTPGDLPAGAAWPFDHPFFLLMDLAVGGDWPGPPDGTTPFPARMSVDWVRVWQ